MLETKVNCLHDDKGGRWRRAESKWVKPSDKEAYVWLYKRKANESQ